VLNRITITIIILFIHKYNREFVLSSRMVGGEEKQQDGEDEGFWIGMGTRYRIPKSGDDVPKIGHDIPKIGHDIPKSGHDIPKIGHGVTEGGV
jgi:hypothetical protein